MKKEIKSHHCKRCGRTLRSAESIERGYGNTCYKSVKFIEKTYKTLFNINKLPEVDNENNR